MNEKQIEKLKKQVKRYEAKGFFKTYAHELLARLQEQPAEGVIPQNTKKVKQEAVNGKQDL